MKRKQALETLLANLEAGEEIRDDDTIDLLDVIFPELQTDELKSNGPCAYDWVIRADSGSVDAALALHEAVVPDQSIRIERRVGGWVVWLDQPFKGTSDSAAHAWLMAIIKALIVMEDETQTSTRNPAGED